MEKATWGQTFTFESRRNGGRFLFSSLNRAIPTGVYVFPGVILIVGKTMKFKNRRHSQTKRNWSPATTPAEVETFESRVLLTTVPNILTPTGTISTPTAEFTWEAVDNAESYDLWVTSLVSYETLFVQRDIADTRFTPAEGTLALGEIRVWVRANLTGGGNSPWSPSEDINVVSAPTLTGPVGVGPNNLTSDNMPTITWDSSLLADRFQLWVTDLTRKAAAEAAAGDEPVDVSLHSTVYTIFNHQPVLDDAGEPVLDDDGNPVTEEVRSFQLPVDPNPNSTNTDLLELPISRYRIWLRAFDDLGEATGWSGALTFDVGPKPQNLSPTAPTFQASPNLLFDSVDGATHYEVYVGKEGMAGPFFRRVVPATSTISEAVRIVQSQAGTPIVENFNDVVEATETPLLDENGNEIPYIIPTGRYTFWVRAVSDPTDGPRINGAWSDPARFETLRAPVITAPVITDGVVTAARPTIEWTEIDGAATYQVLIHKFNSRPPFLDVMSTSNSYKLTDNLPRGDYTVWVRPISTRGELGPWSAGYSFTATGGRPVITAPTPGSTILFPEFEWTAVTDDDVVQYEIWVSYIGVDFTFININVEGTSYTGTEPLNDGDYRVWIRAVFADGSNGLWSDPVDFVGGVASREQATDPEALLASLQVDLSVLPGESADTPAAEPVAPPAVTKHEYEVTPPADDVVSDVSDNPAPAGEVLETPDFDALPASVLSRLAEECVDTAWWEVKTDVS